MKGKLALALGSAIALSLGMTAPASSDPNNETAEFILHIDVPNEAEAPNGDEISITGGGEFAVHPKAVEAEGEFIHTDSEGNLVAEGAWEATRLISFEFYGCGVLEFADPDIILPENFCGGALKMRVLATVTGPPAIAGFETPATLTVFCIIGPQAPSSHDEPAEEGVSLVVPGIANFNKILPGSMNLFEQTS